MPNPPPEPQGVPESIVFDRFDGLKNTVAPERLGPHDLQRAINVDIDDEGQIRRRRGYSRVSAGNYHSLFTADDGTVFGVKNGTLGIIHPDYSFVGLSAAVAADPTNGSAGLAYVQVGSKIYYSSAAADQGIIDVETQTVGPWGDPKDIFLSPVVNPTATLPAVRGRLLGRPPAASALTYFNGRIYLASGRLVWATEPWLYKLVDKTKNFLPFEGDVTMLGAVVDGLYVGTTEGLWFLGGTEFAKMPRRRVMDSPVIPGSMVMVPSELANPPQVGTQADTDMQVSLCFMTTRGFCVAQDGGRAYNLTESKFFFPAAARSAALYRRQDGVNQYIAVNDSEGQPVNGARIGDYVDAEIIRGGASWTDQGDSVVLSDSAVADLI